MKKILFVYMFIGCIWFLITEVLLKLLQKLCLKNGINLTVTINHEKINEGSLIITLMRLGAIFAWPIQIYSAILAIFFPKKFEKNFNKHGTIEKEEK